MTLPTNSRYDRYPTAYNLRDSLAGAGLAGSVALFAQAPLLMQAVAAEFERRVNWLPFLSGDAGETRTFAPPSDGCLDLRGGLVSLTALTLNGQALMSGQQFALRPENAAQRGRPYTFIDFGRSGGWGWGGAGFPFFGSGVGASRPVSVTGLWGFAASLPADVWGAILGQAVAVSVPALTVGDTGRLLAWTEAGVSETYSAKPYDAISEMAAQRFEEAVTRYRRRAM